MKIKQVLSAVALSLAAATISVSGSHAHERMNNVQTRTVIKPMKASYSAAIRKDLNKGYTKVAFKPNRLVYRVDGRLVIQQAAYLGWSPFICTPSGFGQRSACRTR